MVKFTIRHRLAFVFATFLSVFFISSSSAQSVANYSVTRSTGISYSSIISTGVPPPAWRNTGTFEEDDNRSYQFDIGFDFWYDGVRYTAVSVSTNGYIDFSSATNNGGPTSGPYGYSNTQFSSVSGTLNAIAPMYDDMTTQAGTNPLGSGIRYLVTGTAPNRILTIEWTNMAVYQNTTPNLNFQVKLHETTGQIECLYGTMVQGTANFSYTCGINAPTMSGSPTAAQLKCQQTANTTTFSNGQQNNLSALPASNSKLQFTAPTPAAPSGSLTFSSVQTSQMTLNWPNWATNEVGYVIYNSTDGVNYDFITQTAANATNATITGLYSGTTYYWKVCAVTEGWLSNPLSGTQATLGGNTYISVNSGNWATAATWNMNAVPGVNDNVIIASTHTVTINANANCHNLTVGQGGAAVLRFGTNNTSRTLTVMGNITVAANASLTVNTNSNTTHQMNVYGNITNNGTVDLQPDANSFCDVAFLHEFSNQTISGTGATNRYNLITVDKGTDQSRILEVKTSTFTAATGFLTLTNGTFKLSTTGAVSITPFNATADIPSHAKLWINSATATVTTTGGNVNLYGDILMTNGTMTIGSVADNCLVSFGGLLTMNGGTLTIAGRLDRNNTAALTRLTMTGGTMILNSVGSTSSTNAPFMMDVVGSQLSMSGGLIIIRRFGGTGTARLGFLCTGGVINSITGGVLQIGDASTPAAQTIQINTVSPIATLRVASANATAQLITNPLTIVKDVQLQSGTFNANNLNVNVGGTWSNTGGTYTAGTNTTTFNGSGAQTITRTAGAENFNHISFTGGGKTTLGSAINCNNLSITSGDTLDVSSSGYAISMKGNWVNGGEFTSGLTGTVTCNGTTAQTIGGTSLTKFRHLTIQNAAGVSLTANESIRGTLTLTTGTFTTTGYDFTLISNLAGTARIAQITGGNITGNIIMQRYIFLGPTGWRQLCAPVTGLTLADWNDDLVTSGFPGSDYPNFSFYSIETYNETAAGPKIVGYSAPSNITDPITPRKGYFVYVGPLPVSLDVKGPPIKMNQTFTLTYTPSAGASEDGWNMLANPYPSSIDWDAAGWTRTRTDNVLYVWNPTNSQYASYVGGVGVNGGTKNIPSSQAFWIRAVAANPSVSITEATKTATDQAFMHTTQQQAGPVSNLLSLTLKGSAGEDQSIVRFDPSATDTFDIGYDAMKLGSMDTTQPYLSSTMDSVNDLSINALPSLNSNITVPLHVKVGVSGNYIIRRDTVSDLPNSTCVTLEDLLTGTTTQLTQNSSYSFTISDTTSAIRFLLHFGPSLTCGNSAASCSNTLDGKAFAKGTGNGPWDYTWKDASGNVIAVHNSVNGTDTAFGLAPGNYIVEVSGNDGYCSLRSDTVTVDGPVPVSTGATMTPATCAYTSDGELHIMTVTGGTPPYTLTWPDGSHADSLVNIPPGSYPLIVTDGNGCNDTVNYTLITNSTVNATFTATPDTVIIQTLVSFSNYSNGATNYNWNFGDGSPVSSDVNPIYAFTSGGTFTVSLVADDGVCSDTATQTVYVIDNTALLEHAQQGEISVTGAQDAIGVFFDLPDVEQARIQVYDADGKLVAEKEQYVGQGKVEIPMNTMASEMYSVIVLLPKKTYSAKVVLLK